MMNHTTKYLLSGAAATIPMSLAMVIMYQGLPFTQKYPLPPRKITMNVAEDVGVKYFLDESEKESLTLLSHLAYGAVAGALYFPLVRKLQLKNEASGMGYGVLVWAVSYFGILPALKLHQSPLKMPAERNALMIAAHLIWGRSLALINKAISK